MRTPAGCNLQTKLSKFQSIITWKNTVIFQYVNPNWVSSSKQAVKCFKRSLYEKGRVKVIFVHFLSLFHKEYLWFSYKKQKIQLFSMLLTWTTHKQSATVLRFWGSYWRQDIPEQQIQTVRLTCQCCPCCQNFSWFFMLTNWIKNDYFLPYSNHVILRMPLKYRMVIWFVFLLSVSNIDCMVLCWCLYICTYLWTPCLGRHPTYCHIGIKG